MALFGKVKENCYENADKRTIEQNERMDAG